VAAELALREKLGGIVLQSTFTSVPDLGAELFPFLPVHLLSTIKYDTHKKLPLIHVPVLVMHSRTDTLVAFHHAESNFADANDPKQFVEIAGDHNDGPFADPPRFADGMKKFIMLR
jgi:pimeloyl-ACP methyl ester carboxylesterase